MHELSKEQLLKNLKAVIRQMKLLKSWNRKTAKFEEDEEKDPSNIEYKSIVGQLALYHNMTPEQIAIEISKKDTVV